MHHVSAIDQHFHFWTGRSLPNTRSLESLSVGGTFDAVCFLNTHPEIVQKCCTTDRLQTPALLGDTPAE